MSTNSKTLRFAIFGNEYQPKKSTAILTILSFLEQRGAEIYIDRPFYEFLQLEVPNCCVPLNMRCSR